MGLGGASVDVAVDAVSFEAVEAGVEKEGREGKPDDEEDDGENKVEDGGSDGGDGWVSEGEIGGHGETQKAEKREEDTGLARLVDGDAVFTEAGDAVGFEHVDADGGADGPDKKSDERSNEDGSVCGVSIM